MTEFQNKVAKSSLGTRKVTAARASAPADAAARAVARSAATGRRTAGKVKKNPGGSGEK